MLQTCRLDRRPNYKASMAILLACNGDRAPSSTEFLATGSVAEFYIEPALSCVGDIDVMYCATNAIAGPDGLIVVPGGLYSVGYEDVISVGQTVDTEFPGYVLLAETCHLVRSERYERYTIRWKTTNNGQVSMLKAVPRSKDAEIHGPAARMPHAFTPNMFANRIQVQLVRCIRFPVWPPQASD